MMMKFRGWFWGLHSKGTPFIGKGVKLKAKSKIIIGYGVSINDFCYIDALSIEGIEFGNNVSVGPDTKIECTGNLRFLGKGLKVGNDVGLGSNNFYGCGGGIKIGNDSIVGNFVSFHSENHIHSDLNKPIRFQGVTHAGIEIGNNCWIGAKSTILDGAIIEDGCIIAAGAVVKAGVYEKNGIYGGVPARLIKYRY
jgi:acetyltransferase-like isoleucine patch superfamily enzyme